MENDTNERHSQAIDATGHVSDKHHLLVGWLGIDVALVNIVDEDGGDSDQFSRGGPIRR